jgi:uncharacterized protein (TIGR03067 family)
MRWYLALLPLVVFPAGCGSVTDAESNEPAMPALQGKWKLVRFERWGGPWKGGDVGQTWEFTENQIRCPKNASFALDGTYRIRPQEIDIKTPKGKEIPGIWTIEADTLKLCVNEGDARFRPEAFASMGKSEIWLFVFERVRPAAE